LNSEIEALSRNYIQIEEEVKGLLRLTGIYMPTGRYTPGANDNTGLGMWGQELFIGGTVYLDRAKAWHAASTVSFEFHSKKQDSQAQVGNLMTLEGGFGRDFLKGAASSLPVARVSRADAAVADVGIPRAPSKHQATRVGIILRKADQALTVLNTAVLTPMPSARVIRAIAVNAGFFCRITIKAETIATSDSIMKKASSIS
jgi:hypothetical protein